MLLKIDLKGRTVNAVAGLLEGDLQQVRIKELYFGKVYDWALRPSSDRLELRCMLDIHPIDAIPANMPYLTSGTVMGQYVHARAFTAHTALSNAILEIYKKILDKGNEYTWLARPLEITCTLPPLLGSEEVFEEFFGQIGYTCEAEPLEGPQLFSLTIKGIFSLPRILWDLIMILSALDIHRFYWTPADPMNTILERISEYGPQHPSPDLLERVFRINYQSLYDTRIKLLARNDDPSEVREDEDQIAFTRESQVWDIEEAWEKIHNCLNEVSAKKLTIFNTTDPGLLARLFTEPKFESILALGPSLRLLETTGQFLEELNIPDTTKESVQLAIGSLRYLDARIDHCDAVIIPDGFYQIPKHSIYAIESNIFGRSQPNSVLVLIPNADYNVLINNLAKGSKRHPRHEFEWGREQVANWGKMISNKFGYKFHSVPVGPEDERSGPPMQLIHFRHHSQR